MLIFILTEIEDSFGITEFKTNICPVADGDHKQNQASEMYHLTNCWVGGYFDKVI